MVDVFRIDLCGFSFGFVLIVLCFAIATLLQTIARKWGLVAGAWLQVVVPGATFLLFLSLDIGFTLIELQMKGRTESVATTDLASDVTGVLGLVALLISLRSLWRSRD